MFDKLVTRMEQDLVFAMIVLCLLWGGGVLSKECSNTMPELASHTLRYDFNLRKSSSSSEDDENLMKEEVLISHNYHHLPLTDDESAAWFHLIPRKILKEEKEERDWVMSYEGIIKKKKKNHGDGGSFLKEVPLEDVRLLPHSVHWQGQQTNLEYLLLLDVDKLLWSFRKTARLPTPLMPYGGWEDPNSEVRGHFVGHYLSATAMMWASTSNESIKERMTALVSGLHQCQKKLGNGYLSAFPSELFDRIEDLHYAWAPYYTIHKIMQGLLDQYTFAGNKQAFEMLNWMVDYFYNRVNNVIRKYSIERHWALLNEETGGMNDVLYQLYAITGNQKHLTLAHLFDKPCFLGLLAVDDISGFHANTHIPVVIGAQMRYQVTGDTLYKDISSFFMDIINSSHTYATGGSTVNEFWSDPKRLASTLESETEEGCTVYNMLKVARNLFRWTKEPAYADYYERALTNGVLPIQRGTEPGVMIYMLPLKSGGSKATSYHGWGTQFDSFWCDYGTGVESFSKLGDSIYFEEKGNNPPGLYIIQYISSSFRWKSAGILLDLLVDHIVSWNPRLKATVTISPMGAGPMEKSTLNIRIPVWAYGDGAKVSLNDHKYSQLVPGNFFSISHKWTAGDKISIELPLNLRTEAIQDDRPEFYSIRAILYGPYVLAGLSTGDWDVTEQPHSSIADLINPIPMEYNSNLKSFSQESAGNSSLVLTKVNRTVVMEKFNGTGTDVAAGATFRLISSGTTPVGKVSSRKEKLIMLEPYDLPGAVLKHQGKDEHLTVVDASEEKEDVESSVFDIVTGLDGEDGTVSLESDNLRGCYLRSNKVDNCNNNENKSDARIKLSCKSASSPNDEEFKREVSFKFEDGFSKYHAMNFVLKGKERNFLLTPLVSIRDESYTVYFNFV